MSHLERTKEQPKKEKIETPENVWIIFSTESEKEGKGRKEMGKNERHGREESEITKEKGRTSLFFFDLFVLIISDRYLVYLCNTKFKDVTSWCRDAKPDFATWSYISQTYYLLYSIVHIVHRLRLE